MKRHFYIPIIFLSLTLLSACETTDEKDNVIQVESITINQDDMTLEVEQTASLTATVLPENAKDKSVTWSSSDENIAIVSSNGRLLAMGVGKAVITAKAGKQSDFITVTVTQKSIPVTGISIDKPDFTIKVGETETLTAAVSPENATNKTVIWTSSDPEVATVEDGVVTGVKLGIVTITATTEDGGFSAECPGTIKTNLAPSVTVGTDHLSPISVMLKGKANLESTASADLVIGFQYSTSSGILPSNATFVEATEADSDYNYSVGITGLDPSTTYYFRSVVRQNGMDTYGETKSFTTKDIASMLQTLDADDIGVAHAQLNARLDLTDVQYTTLEYGFNWGPAGEIQSSKAKSANISGTSYSATLSSLSSAKQYSHKAYVVLDGRAFYAEVKTFSTNSISAVVTTDEASNLGSLNATLNGRLKVETQETLTQKVWFLYGGSSLTTLELLKSSGSQVNISNWTSGKESFSYSLSKLNAGTYYYVAVAKVHDTVFYGDVVSFDVADFGVEVKTEEATGIGLYTGTLCGNVTVSNGNGLSRSAGFRYSATANTLTSLKSSGTAVTATLSDDGAFSKSLSGLILNTKYYYVAYATVNGRTVYGDMKSFTTSDINAAVTTEDAYVEGYSAAMIMGSLNVSNPESLSKSVWFLYSTTATTLNSLKVSGTKVASTLSGDGSFGEVLKNLSSNTTYYFVACAKVKDREFYGEVKSFKTEDINATLTTNPATDLGLFTATLNGSLTVSGSMDKSVWFLWSNTASDLSGMLASGTKVSSTLGSDGNFTCALSSLEYNTIYYYVACAKVYDKEIYGEVKSFTTKNASVETLDASNVSATTAMLYGKLTVNSTESLSTSVWFLYSATKTTLSALQSSGTKASSTLGTDGSFEKSLTGLSPNKKYYYVAVAQVHNKKFYGEVYSFTTLPAGAIDLGLSVLWATSNLSASGLCANPQDYGDYYAWGETEPKSDYSYPSYKFGTSVNGPFSRYNTNSSYGTVDNKTEFKDYDYVDDAARKKLVGKWRTPTDAEWTELRENCTWTWTNNYNNTGVAGRIVTSNKTGYTDKSIFLPAAGGYWHYGELDDAGSLGFYWSSSLDTDNPRKARSVYFDSGSAVARDSRSRYYGFPIRPVTE